MNILDFLPWVLVDAPGCPDIVAQRAVVDAAREFCEHTNAWNVLTDPIILIDRSASYDLDVPTDGEIVKVMAVYGPLRPLVAKSLNDLGRIMPNWQSATSALPLYFNSAGGRTQVTVYPTPLLANRAKVTPRVVYKPSLLAATLPDDLVSDCREALVDGALARLMLNANKTWSNPQLAGVHSQRFGLAMEDKRMQVLLDNTEGSVNVQPAAPFGL